MHYIDSIYGAHEIDEPVILELIDTPAMQRLKGIDQAWYFEPYFPDSSSSRFDHSVGVFLLLRKYGAPLEEQISWLLHDVSHGTFSHCLDYVFAEWSQKEQNHQDNIFESFIRKTDIPAILKKYDLDVEYIIDDTHFPLKETKLPDLCADRIDYSLRDAEKYKVYTPEQIWYILEHLVVKDGKRIFTDFASAKAYGELFHHMNETYYASSESAIMFHTVGDYLKHAWQQWYVQSDDFYTTDRQILDKIASYIESDSQLAIYWQRMNNQLPYTNDPNDFDFNVFCKSRIVDPLCMEGDEIKRVSSIDTAWKIIIEAWTPAKEYFFKFEK